MPHGFINLTQNNSSNMETNDTEQHDYLEVNRKLWNERTQHHVQSEFYDNAAFMAGKNTLNDIELSLLGDVQHKQIMHLQCHFGQDTLSLARMGATVTGVDISEQAVATAMEQAHALDLPATFIAANVYDVDKALNGRFDIVFSSYGTIGWLPDMRRWAKVVSRLLKPGGMFVFAEFHPAVWMFDNDFQKIAYSYFNREAIIEQESGTYADRDAPMQLHSVTWNHSLDEVLQSLLDEGLQLRIFREYDYSPYNCLKDMTEGEPGRFYVKGAEGKLPMVYALQMVKV